MRVLWFPGNGAIYANTNKYNGGGWTASLADEMLRTNPDIKMGMVIPWDKYFKDKQGNVCFYGMPQVRHGIFFYNRKLRKQLETMKKIIIDFKPDIIHVFGSEHTGGMIACITDIPVVLHIQGILHLWKETWLPQNLSWEKFFLWHPRQWFHMKGLERACKMETIIFHNCHNYMGRTDMDKRISKILSPNRHYFYCSEMLRSIIYHSNKIWHPHPDRRKKKIISIISPPIYKGGDIVLRTSKVLKECANFDFEWFVYGVDNIHDCERLTKISANNVNVKIGGIITAETLISNVEDADIYVHPSYIENSPNTICEAQLLGIPVIANNVGGTSSLIKNQETGILVPVNDIYQTASYIIELCMNTNKAITLGNNARKVALKRHNPAEVVATVLDIYEKTLKQDN